MSDLDQASAIKEKAIRVIMSCETLEQFDVAVAYAKLACASLPQRSQFTVAVCFEQAAAVQRYRLNNLGKVIGADA